MDTERAIRRSPSLFSLAVLAAMAAAAIAGPASARDRYDRYDDDRYAEREPAQRTNVPDTDTSEPGTGREAMLAVVSLGDQHVTIYGPNGPIMQGPVSSGATPNDTPVGIYSVLQKNREHYSNRYDDAAMPFMQRITWTGIALHAGQLPGYPASHGCVRLREDFARELFDKTKRGMRVIISRNNMTPAPISHPLLFKPTPFRDNVAVLSNVAITVPPTATGPNDPPELATRTASLQALMAAKTAEAEGLANKVDAARILSKQKARESAKATKAVRTATNAHKNAVEWLADAERDLARAKKPSAVTRAEEQKTKAAAKIVETKTKLDAVTAANKPALDEAAAAAEALKVAVAEQAAVAAAARDAERKLSPVSVFVSLKTKKLYVRQAYEPIFEADVTIRDPETPIGTHTFTALDYQPGGRDMRWNVVSISGRQPGEPEKSSGMNQRKRSQSVEAIPTDAAAATAALDRIEIPRETVDRINELVLPGSSLIVSDEGAHKETGKATDFVVLISGEPAGGIVLRPKPRDEYYDDYGYGPGPFWGYDNRRQRRQRGPFGGGKFPWW
ncbi:MAG: L,D-transpeptidase family protein [Hyphomicrobium sp.]|nr:L,D-transpeptidase family protein [Hyphomicrobium sp.]